MEIDENKVYASRLIEGIDDLSRRHPTDSRSLLRTATFVIFLHCLKEAKRGQLQNYALKINKRIPFELIEDFLSADSIDYELELEELLDIFTKQSPSLLEAFSYQNVKVPEISLKHIIGYAKDLETSVVDSESTSFHRIFQHLIDYSASTNKKYNKNLTDAISVISSTVFSQHVEEIIEYFPFSANPILEFSNHRSPPPSVIFDITPKGFELEYWMRSVLSGATVIGRDQIGRPNNFNRESSISIIDPSYAPAKDNNYWKSYVSYPKRDFVVPIDFIIERVEASDSSDYTVVAVRARDISKKGYFANGMAGIVEKNCVLAVIDIPRTNKSKGAWSIWVLRNINGQEISDYKRKHTLFLSAEILKNLTFSPDNHQIYLFVSIIVKQFIFGDYSIDPEYELKQGFLEFYKNLFENGYKDVEGLCKLASIEEIREKSFKLAAKNFVEPIEKGRYSKGVDSSILSETLKKNSGLGMCYFLIGDNGQGKSVVLSKLADSYSRQGRLSLAISFGVMDRFHFVRKTDLSNSFYRYLGGRTSKNGARTKDLSSEIAKRLISAEEANRNALFVELASSVGFSADYFLIPHLDKGTSSSQYSQLGDVINIFSDNPRDEQLLSSYRNKSDLKKNSFQLGLKRKNESFTIIPFSELSSGEQQILNLLSKLIFNAERDSIIFIDEPEISLHVGWQRAVPQLLSRISKKFACDIVVATHSPIIISEAMVNDSECFSVNSSVISRMDSIEKNSIESVLFDYFKTNTFNNREIHEKCASLLSEAIKRRNLPDFDDHEARRIIKEIGQMERTVKGSMFGNDQNSTTDLNIINKTRQAIEEVFGMPFEEPDAEWGE